MVFWKISKGLGDFQGPSEAFKGVPGSNGGISEQFQGRFGAFLVVFMSVLGVLRWIYTIYRGVPAWLWGSQLHHCMKSREFREVFCGVSEMFHGDSGGLK